MIFLRPFPALLALFLGVTLPLEASSRLSESFSTPADGLPANWKATARGPATATRIAIEEVPNAATPGLLIERTRDGAGSGAVWYTGPELGSPDGKIRDFQASVIFRVEQPPKSNSSTRGMAFRANRLAYDKYQGYYVAVQAWGDKRGLGIYFNPQSHVNDGTELAFTPLRESLKTGEDYLLQVKVAGSEMEAALWKVTREGTKERLLAETKTTDNQNLEPGYFGLRGGYGNTGPIKTWFRSLHLHTP